MISKICIAIVALVLCSGFAVEPATVDDWRNSTAYERGQLTRRICEPIAGSDIFERVRLQRSLTAFISRKIAEGYTGKLSPIVDDWGRKNR